MALQIVTIKNNPVDSNCFLIVDKEVGNGCVIVDPGCKDTALLEYTLKGMQLAPECVILTHEHFDHVWGCNYLYEKYKIAAYASALCIENVKSDRLNCSRYYDDTGFEVNIPMNALEVADTVLYWAGYGIEFLFTPGHSDASICFSVDHCLFTGDTLIPKLKTVTNILSGSKQKLKGSIEKLELMKGRRYTVYPGHGAAFQLDEYDLNNMIE